MENLPIAHKTGRNVYLDLFKFLLAFMVICIHLVGETYSIFPLYRLAVPSFFLISGYFAYNPNVEQAKKKAPAFVWRCAKYMLIGIGFYTAYEFVSYLIDGTNLGWFFTTIFYEGDAPLFHFFVFNAPIPYYTVGAQIWFLIALFVVSILHYLLVKFNKTKWYKIIVPISFAIYFFFSGFMYIIQPSTDIPIRYMRNAWFFGLPCFGLGYLTAQIQWHKKSWYKYVYLVLALAFFFLQLGEHALIARENHNLEMYISGVLSAVFFLQFFLGLKKTDCKFYYDWIGKSAYFYVYILHMGVAVTLSKFVSFSNLYIKSLMVLLISFAIYEICFLLGKLIKNIRKKHALQTNKE